jgi:hypothetical protein
LPPADKDTTADHAPPADKDAATDYALLMNVDMLPAKKDVMDNALPVLPACPYALVGRFKFFSTIYGKKCHLFFRHFSLKKEVKISNIFHHYSRWNLG